MLPWLPVHGPRPSELAMATFRIPESFFTPVRASQLRQLLDKLVPPADSVVALHLDAPSLWLREVNRVADPTASKPVQRPSEKPSLIASVPSPHGDRELDVLGHVLEGALFWQWHALPRFEIHGRLEHPSDWQALLIKMREIRPEFAVTLHYAE